MPTVSPRFHIEYFSDWDCLYNKKLIFQVQNTMELNSNLDSKQSISFVISTLYSVCVYKYLYEKWISVESTYKKLKWNHHVYRTRRFFMIKIDWKHRNRRRHTIFDTFDTSTDENSIQYTFKTHS